MKRNSLATLGLLLVVAIASILPPTFGTNAFAQAGGPMQQVSGVVINGAGQPVPECRVQLQNQQVGASYPVLTNAQGFYFFPQVPVQVQSPYILQIYWGPQLVYQGYLTHLGQQQPIQLR